MYRLAIGRRHMETTQARAERYRQEAARVRENAYKARNPSTRQALLDYRYAIRKLGGEPRPDDGAR